MTAASAHAGSSTPSCSCSCCVKKISSNDSLHSMQLRQRQHTLAFALFLAAVANMATFLGCMLLQCLFMIIPLACFCFVCVPYRSSSSSEHCKRISYHKSIVAWSSHCLSLLIPPACSCFVCVRRRSNSSSEHCKWSNSCRRSSGMQTRQQTHSNRYART